MKTIPLRQLVREPRKVKRWTKTGQSVQVTDRGEPLWIIRSANQTSDPSKRNRDIDELLEEVLREPRSSVSAARLLEGTRR